MLYTIYAQFVHCEFEMQKSNEVLDMRLMLEGEVKERFLKIKANKGLANNTEVVRLLIMEYPLKEEAP